MTKTSNEEVIVKIIGKLSLEIEELSELNQQLRVKKVLEEVLYDYDVLTKEKSLVASDIDEKLEMYLACKKLDGLSRKTLKGYYYEISKFSRFMKKPVSSITTMDIRMYLATACNTLKETSKGTVISNLKSFFSWLQNEEYIIKNPMVKIKVPKVPKRLREGLTLEELELLREACITDRERALIELLYSTGCRISEIMKMNIQDLDLHDLSVNVTGKGQKERKVLFTPKAKILILKYLKSRKGTSEALFINSKRPYGRISVRSLEREVEKIKNRAGFNKSVYPHLIRHTYCTHKANSGMNMTALQELMGHESLATTQRYFKLDTDLIRHEYRKISS